MPTVAVTVELNWRAARHYAEQLKPCRICGSPTHGRDGSGVPCDHRCAVQEAEQELLRLAAVYFAGLETTSTSVAVEKPEDVVRVAEPVPAWAGLRSAPDQRRPARRARRRTTRAKVPVDGRPATAEHQGDVGGQQPRRVSAGAQ